MEDCIDTCGTGGDGMNTLKYINRLQRYYLASMGVKSCKTWK